MTILYGLLERITYHNEENDFVVAKLQEHGKKELTTIVGHLPAINPGETLKVSGQWVNNKKFGQQFQVETCEVTVPATVHGIRKYLGSGLIKGIGPVMAERIVEKFALDTLEVIEKRPERLAEVEAIGPKRIAMIRQAWEEQKEIKEIMIFLHGHGVSAAYSAKIYKRYGNDAIAVVRNNPYRLARDIHGIGFISADRIAQQIGIDRNSITRAKAGILHVLNQLSDEGHVFYPERELVQKAKAVLEVDDALLLKAVTELSIEKEIVLEDLQKESGERGVYGAAFHAAEVGIAQKLRRLAESPSAVRPIHAERAIEWVERRLNIELAEKQREAVLQAARSKVLVITGGPGTGKTTIIRAILEIFRQLKLTISLAAPTGRAAKRMSEATGCGAKTIHRLLEYSPQQQGFKEARKTLWKQTLVILDEVSMVDTLLMYHLMKALPERAHLILVGDTDQLPSVGPGNVLRDIIASGRFTVVRLIEVFRQAKQSMIIVNAHRINRGEFPILKERETEEETLADFYFVEEEDPEKVPARIIHFCSESLPQKFGFDPVRDIQVLTPMHKGAAGVANLTIELQKALNRSPSEILHGTRTFRLGDKVLQVTNNYDKEVFNGDIGRIAKIDREEREVNVDFDGRLVRYEFSELDELVLAYAISVHKSQGTEYPAVIIPVTTQHYVLLQRNLLYTAVTRAKRLVILVGSKRALAIALKNNKPQWRFTRLRERLVG